MIDSFGRTIDYLRVSITDRCNFRCVYCMPEEGFPATPKDEHLTADEFVRLIRIAASLGTSKVRLTGGEPLVRKDLGEMVSQIAEIPGIIDLSCTTNGFLLAEQAAKLRQQGLNRINVSLDTLHEGRFQAIARRGALANVLQGIDAALDAGLQPLKINCVAMRGANLDEAADFAAMTVDRPVHVRFIELMPIRWNLDENGVHEPFQGHSGHGLVTLNHSSGSMLSDLQMQRMFVSAADVRAEVESRFGELEPA